MIGRNCYIGPNSVFLPSTAIGDKCSIGSFTELKYSVIMDDVRIGAGSVVSNSVSGSHNTLDPHFATEIKKELVIEIKGLLHQVVQLGTIIGDSNITGTRVLVQAGKMISTGCSVESGVTVTRNIPEKAIVI